MAGKEIGIVGAGLMGMALAHKLSADGHVVTVIENSDKPGGLATWHDFGPFTWDRFYHVILPSDRHLIGLINNLGMSDHLQWQRTYTGFYIDHKLHSISSNIEFLKFPLLSLVSKIRLGFTMLYGSRINDWQKLETQSCEQWLRRVSGNETFEKLWKPLLLAKLGPSYKRVSAVFIWSYIKRMFSARDKSASAEQLGHVKGGYESIFHTLQNSVTAADGNLRLNESVTSIQPTTDDRMHVQTDKHSYDFDHVVCTSPVNVLKQIVSPEMIQLGKPGLEATGQSVSNATEEVEYLGVVCVVIVSKTPLTHYYVVNIADDTIPFTGLIGMSNVVNPENTENHHLTYLPRYLLSTDDELKKSDNYFKELFLAGVKSMFPDYNMDDIVSVHVNRAIKVQPLQVLNYSNIVPAAQTRHDRLHILNTSQFVNATLNNNEVIGAVNAFHHTFSNQLEVN